MLQPAASSAEDIFAPNPVANAPAMAHVNPKGHIRTAGEKKFDRVTYNWLGYVANALLSVVAVAWVERTHGGQKMMNNFRGWAERNVKFVNPETAKMLATKTFFLAGGFAVMLPMKWLEDKKLEMVKKYDRQIYGDAVDTDPSIRQSHQDIENAPKQNWKSILGSRILALVPFYAGYWLLWDKKSPLAKATNESLFVDRPIVAASRGIGKFFAKLTKNGEAEKTLSELNQTHLGEMLTPVEAGKIATKPDPLHSTVPYYFMSEAITSAMVAWGVYVLSRVLAPILGTKKEAAPQVAEKEIIATSNISIPKDGRGAEVVNKARSHGVSIAPLPASHNAEDAGGYYDADSKTVYVNTARPAARQTSVLVHECQHACNLFDKKVLDKKEAARHGETAYTENFLVDEARAHAASFIYNHESKAASELQSHAMQSLFSDVAYEGATDTAFEHYADHALNKLKHGALGYREKAKESYIAHAPAHTAPDVKEQPEEKTSEKKRELPESKPDTKVHADSLQHHHTHHAEAAHAHGAH